MSNVVDLSTFRKEQEKKKEKSRPIMAFEPNQYYIFPKMGIMIHVLFITDKSCRYENKPIYVMEDQYGNLFAELVEEDTCEGWHELHPDVFNKALKRLSKDNPDDDPSPRVS